LTAATLLIQTSYVPKTCTAVEIGLAKSALADIFLLKHAPGTLNIEARDSVCAFRGIHFGEENCFVLGFQKSRWLIENGCAFLTERGRLHKYSHFRDVLPDTVLSIRFSPQLLECMDAELPAIRFTELGSFLGVRNDLRFLRWRLNRLPEQCREFATDEWVIDLVIATYLNPPQSTSRNFPDMQLAWYAERIDAAREQLVKRFADEHRLRELARSVGMSTFQFARMFHELVGFAPHQYLLHVRYRSALHMLLEGASVTDACFQSGFSNLSHFTREFKTRFGQRPSAVKSWPRHLRIQRFATTRLPPLQGQNHKK
jgi:AraC-like DNA-binding protein